MSLSGQYLEASNKHASSAGYKKARFLVSNLLWHEKNFEKPEPIELKIRDWQIIVTPKDDYETVGEQLTNRGGQEPTAWISVKTQGGLRKPLEQFKELIDDLMFVFRLATGNHVNWYYGEGFDPSSGESVERIHQYATSSSFSKTIRFSLPKSNSWFPHRKLDFALLVDAFFNDSGHVLDKKDLKILINQFTEASTDTQYLESRGLMASTLTEFIASRYAEKKGKSEAIPKSKYEKDIRGELWSAINKLSLEEKDRKHLRDHVIGGYRSSLRSKMRLLSKELDLPLNDKNIKRLGDIRNSLVHEGTDPQLSNDYDFIVHTNLIVLCRLLGYKGPLPELRDGYRIEV